MTNQPATVPVVTIDGPSGSGKGTVGLAVAKALRWHFLDSGVLYRVLALAALQKKCALEDEAHLAKIALTLNIQFHQEVMLDGMPVTRAIRLPECTEAASKIAVFPAVRQALLAWQRKFCQLPGLIADGRDMGTVVFPEAMLKIFLEASVKERADRRFRQLKEMGTDVRLDSLLAEIAARDARDRGRVVAPLIPAEDAVVIDTTHLGTEAVIECVMREINVRLRDF
jgi:cytidylate kinase